MDKTCILILDDNPEIREIINVLLGGEGFEVSEAENGAQALTLIEQQDFDLIILDIMMPVMDGYAAAKAIRTRGQARAGTVPIIAMSANAYAEDVKKCLDSGMNAHISKPLFKDVMLRTIARFV